MKSHTPGPWSIDTSMESERLHVIWSEHGNAPGTLIARTCFAPNSEANAKLIASAPDLLAAMLQITNGAPTQKPDWVDSDNHGDTASNAAEIEHYRLAQIARAAIAKATAQ